jgi:hypothetical protein
MNSDQSNKESYDTALAFNRITPENWLLPDRKNHMPIGITSEVWIRKFLEPKLDAGVPLEVIRVFEVARAAMIYSWFFYPLATLGLEQCTRIGEFAVRERCRMLNEASDNFARNIQTLLKNQTISAEDSARWHALRNLRNDRSHLKEFLLADSGQAAGFLRTLVERINALFATAGDGQVRASAENCC